MRIGIIGAGPSASCLPTRWPPPAMRSGWRTRCDRRASGRSFAAPGIQAVAREDAVREADVVILSVPFARMAELSGLPTDLRDGVPATDTSDYDPARDGQIVAQEAGDARAPSMELSVLCGMQSPEDLAPALVGRLRATLPSGLKTPEQE